MKVTRVESESLKNATRVVPTLLLQLINIEEREFENCLVLEDSWIHSYEVVKAQALLLG